MIEGIKSSSDENYFDNFWKNRMIQDLSKIVIKNANESKPIYNLAFINNDMDMNEHEKKIDEHIHKKVFKKDKDTDNKIIYQKNI